MSIVWVVPVLARSCGESPSAGEPDLIRWPGVAPSPATPASRCAVWAHRTYPRARPDLPGA
jgi:hypothetical protein